MTNAELAQELRELRDLLVIGGYDEMRALRFLSLATEIEELREDVNALARENRLEEIPGVGKQMAVYLREYLETGTSSKRREAESLAPPTLLALLRLSNIGVKTVRRLYHEFGIADLPTFRHALETGRLEGQRGIGQKTLESWRRAVSRSPE
ncbi:MAG TPA: helix-hairpin-helix domain-containing protein [Fimbriimonadaceae bacterium]|nr:helix-hairpin-helix domain-containing protein [Fimbriimonadaceae bacterium]